MGKIKGNTTIVEIAETTLVSQRNLTYDVSMEYLPVAGYSGKSKHRKPTKKYSFSVQLSGLYDPDDPMKSSHLLIDKLSKGELVKVYFGNDLMGYKMFLGYLGNVKEELNKNDLVSYQASILSSSDYADIIIPWILADGTWSDEGIWKDFETWNDN